jgi:hypothetical protein
VTFSSAVRFLIVEGHKYHCCNAVMFSLIENCFIAVYVNMTALLVAARIYDFNRTIKDIVKVVRLSEGTIKKRLIISDILLITNLINCHLLSRLSV